MTALASENDQHWELNEWITGIARSDLPLQPLLDFLSEKMTPPAWEELRLANEDSAKAGKMVGAWWDSVGTWLPESVSADRNMTVFNWLFGTN